MKTRGGLKERFPAFFTLGDGYRPLTREEEVGADFDTRLRAVWPFIVTKIALFHAKLRPRERAVADPEDISQIVWLQLREKDRRWEPERGRYSTFVGKVIRHEFCTIREQARTVKSPRNSGCRLREYQDEEDAGTLTERKARTRLAIQRSAGEYDALEGEDADDRRGGTDDAADRAEEKRIARDAILRGMVVLTTDEATILGQTAGLGGSEPRKITAIAQSQDRKADEVGQVRRRAIAKIRERLVMLGHVGADMAR